jgi:hypothetical protein
VVITTDSEPTYQRVPVGLRLYKGSPLELKLKFVTVTVRCRLNRSEERLRNYLL